MVKTLLSRTKDNNKSKKKKGSTSDPSQPFDPNDAIDRTIAARLIGVARETINSRVRSGALRSVLVGGKKCVLRSEVINLHLSSHFIVRRRSDAELLDTVLELADRLGRLPNRIEYVQHGTMSVLTLASRFRKWSVVREMAYQQGLPYWKETRCRQCGGTFARRIGRSKRSGAKCCSFYCQRDSDLGLPQAIVFNGEKYKKQSNGFYYSDRDRGLLHYSLWEHYHGKVPEFHRVNFIDGDKTNCRIENLYLKKIKPHPPCTEPGCTRKAVRPYGGGRCRSHLQQ